MNQVPEISVVMSTYCRNHGEGQCPNMLVRALESILSQTFSNFELILIDDGSMDGSAEVLKGYAEKDVRIRYIRFDQNSGLPAKRYNHGISLSKGKWIAFMFDDDEWLPNALEDLYQAIIVLPPIYGMVNGTVQYNYLQEGVNKIICADFGLESDSFRRIFMSNRLANNSVLIRREVFDLVGGYDETPCMRRICDWDLWIRIAMQYKIKAVPKKVAKVYQGLPDSLLHNFKLNHHFVYARQLLYFRKHPLRKFYFRMTAGQWKHFLTLLAWMPFYISLRYIELVLRDPQSIRRFLPKRLIKLLKPVVRIMRKYI